MTRWVSEAEEGRINLNTFDNPPYLGNVLLGSEDDNGADAAAGSAAAVRCKAVKAWRQPTKQQACCKIAGISGFARTIDTVGARAGVCHTCACTCVFAHVGFKGDYAGVD